MSPTADGKYETQSSAFIALGTHSVDSALCPNGSFLYPFLHASEIFEMS